MRIVITESQAKHLIEDLYNPLDNEVVTYSNRIEPSEGDVNEQIPGLGPAGGYDYQKPKAIMKAGEELVNIDPHVLLGSLEFGAEFIPEIGPIVAAGLSAVDAAVYLKQGRKKEAGLALVLGCIPFAGQLINKIPVVKQLGSKGLTILADKIAKGITKLTVEENEVMIFINFNKSLIHQEMDGLFKRTAKTIASNKAASSLHPIVNKVADAADAGVNYLKGNVVNNAVKKGYENAYDALVKK